MKTRAAKIGLIAATIALAVAPGSTMISTPASAQDVQAYCARVGDDDRVQPIPDALLPIARRMFDVEAATSNAYVQATTSVRCMNRAVWLCSYGANLVCDKADTSRDSPGAERFCKQNPDRSVSPWPQQGMPRSTIGNASVGRRALFGRS